MDFYNKDNGRTVIFGEAVTLHLEDGRVFSGVPTADQLLDWGYEPRIEPEPTEEELEAQRKRQRMQEIESELASMDYLTSKYIDGEDMSQYGDWQGHRKALRAEYNELEASLNSND